MGEVGGGGGVVVTVYVVNFIYTQYQFIFTCSSIELTKLDQYFLNKYMI